ncbi:MAG: hypothetical protein ACLFU9_06860 [Candidatus Bathyarchaeia archaeon]
MRKELDRWRLYSKTEDTEQFLCRFLIALDELRARLSPRYPNLEVTDEGHLWFNIDTTEGTFEILAFPFGFKKLEGPTIAASLPCKATDVDPYFLKKLHQTADKMIEAKAFAAISTYHEIMDAYRQNTNPPLTFFWKPEEMLKAANENVFFSYLGIGFSVAEKMVGQVEQTIKDVLLKLDLKIIPPKETRAL